MGSFSGLRWRPQTRNIQRPAAGSTSFHHQRQKNGVNISGLTYATPATTVAGNGMAFTVQVSNPLGNDMSNPVTLTVRRGRCRNCSMN
jgi:hypothetical protein